MKIEMKCEFCDSSMVEKHVKRMHWRKGELYIVENVPAYVCQFCGERYFHAKTLDAIDVMLSSEHVVERRLEVEVVSLPV